MREVRRPDCCRNSEGRLFCVWEPLRTSHNSDKCHVLRAKMPDSTESSGITKRPIFPCNRFLAAFNSLYCERPLEFAASGSLLLDTLVPVLWACILLSLKLFPCLLSVRSHYLTSDSMTSGHKKWCIYQFRGLVECWKFLFPSVPWFILYHFFSLLIS